MRGHYMSLRELEEDISRNMVLGICRKANTLNEQIERYLRTKVNLANSTKENYKYYFEHIIRESRIGKTKVTDIRKSDILLFYNSLTEQGLSIGTVKIIHKIIRPSLQLACDDDVISKNPADGCTKDYIDNPEKKFALSFDEEEEFLARIKLRPQMKRYYPMYAILLKTGLRISEAIGLTWGDISMDLRAELLPQKNPATPLISSRFRDIVIHVNKNEILRGRVRFPTGGKVRDPQPWLRLTR